MKSATNCMSLHPKAKGKLYLYELSDYDNIRQVRMDPDEKLIYDVKTEIIKTSEISRPVKYVAFERKAFRLRIIAYFKGSSRRS